MEMIKEAIYWTGSIDWNLRNFHGYQTPRGSTYNAYLIVDEQPTLIDTVKVCGFDEMLSRIKEVIDPQKIKYIISNHTEMDHSGSIDALLSHCPNATVVCSPKGHVGLTRHFLPHSVLSKNDWKIKVVENGESLRIGKRTLQFTHMPMVHWPDSMATYIKEDKILFPNDAFGQHYASTQRYADEVDFNSIIAEAAKYYANIVLPYGAQVLKAIEDLKKNPIEIICPSHGVCWRRKEDIENIVGLYTRWANYQSMPQAVIIYDTMWHSTEKMAWALYQFFTQNNIAVKVYNLQQTHISDVITEVMLSRYILIGSPILNNKILPTMAALLTYMKGLKPRNRFAFTFGSYGWSTVGFKELEDSVKESGMELLSQGTYINYIPDKTELDSLKNIVEKIKQGVK